MKKEKEMEMEREKENQEGGKLSEEEKKLLRRIYKSRKERMSVVVRKFQILFDYRQKKISVRP